MANHKVWFFFITVEITLHAETEASLKEENSLHKYKYTLKYRHWKADTYTYIGS